MEEKLVGLKAVHEKHPGNKIIMIRHGKKLGQNIDPECIKQIVAEGIPGVEPNLIDIFCAGSNLIRTAETTAAFMIHFFQKTGEYIHMGDDESFGPQKDFGNDEMFAELFPDWVKKEMKEKGLSHLEAAKLQPEVYKKHQAKMVKTLEKMFDDLKSASDVEWMRYNAFVSTHSPTVEMIAEAHEYKVEGNMPELNGLIFVPTDKGIKVYPLR